jgi:hypothetical protein
MLLRRCFRSPLCFRSSTHRSLSSKVSTVLSSNVETDEFGLPLKPTWSVKELLSSYPPPTLEPETLVKLHKLAALKPPPQGSEEFGKLRSELSELIKLVEAVKTIEVDKGGEEGIPDGRIWQEGRGISFDEDLSRAEEPSGRALLEHAGRTAEGFYVVDSSRKQ